MTTPDDAQLTRIESAPAIMPPAIVEPALRHGAYSPAITAPIVRLLMASFLADEEVTWLRLCDYPLVETLKAIEAQIICITDWLAKVGAIDEKGKVRPAVAVLGLLADKQRRLTDRLCLNPAQRAELAVAAQPDDLRVTLQWLDDNGGSE